MVQWYVAPDAPFRKPDKVRLCKRPWCRQIAYPGKQLCPRHLKEREKDYIQNPKKDGYRGVHLIYRYKSDKISTYDGLLIEVQIRSKIQHAWATAIEIVDLFTGQAIKSNEGEEEWKEFFRLVSSAFAKIEKQPEVSGTPIEYFKTGKVSQVAVF